MQLKKGKHSKEEGPIKSIILGVGFVFVVMGLIVLFGNKDASGLIFGGLGAGIIWLGSKIPDKNVVKW